MNPRLQKLVSNARILQKEMWRHHHKAVSKRRSAAFAVGRVVAITFSGLKENRLLARAAALSFSSLLGLGPMIALAVLLSGFVLNQAEPGMAQDTIERIVSYIAPQVTLTEGEAATEQSGLSNLISDFIEASQSGAVGIGGALVLGVIVIQLFITIEDAFNDIWGVSKGRKLVTRIILYWTIITLGTVLVFAGLAIAVSKLIELNNQFIALTEGLPGSETVNSWLSLYGVKIASFLIISSLLAAFYRFIPNTQVEWKAAFVGGLFSVSCFAANNAFAFLYVERVAMQRTLYGSLSILPVLMIGLFTFWMCLLLGGRLSFAVQNARFKSGKVAWDELSQASQESLCLLLLAQISRRFRDCGEAYSSTDLAERNNLPSPLAGAALNRLVELGLASTLPAKEKDTYNAYRYQPARPLEKIALLDFKKKFESHGTNPDDTLFDNRDPLVRRYHELIDEARRSSFQQISLAEALDAFEEPRKA
ncbi:YihY/virulence factor BrkB family protein [Pelagicoccus sp. SDUM812005]|uniref:YihY/virulence factor BrkB family protein n=1 Tax=Pelagicoccus sp. SDUM812005 TaxID=3041257 RepID=UPI002810300B|nr:YihY/virulence factor BrkB family protein [Pelagicoccus sp. SDUM812005]MDQ8180601.1 YihY/virulence factor BrkB family protein [Pelagicoccus sp. SDUM812005]